MVNTQIEAGSVEGNPTNRKPRLALMGEFSAGKSTLSNMLLGSAPLPVRVTATRLPPVWISYGEEKALRVDLNGTEHQLDIEDIPNTQLEETKLIKLFLQADALELCDLIDMPGISDPNMTSSVWESVFSEVDNVVWCTHATQAWRQSEAAAWDLVRSRTNGNNLIVISQFDKLRNDRDKQRVLERVLKETDGLFQGVFPVSLTDALKSGEDSEKWERSGAGRFTEELVEMLLCSPGADFTPSMPAAQFSSSFSDGFSASAVTHDISESAEKRKSSKADMPAAPTTTKSNYHENPPQPAITPRRIRTNSNMRTRTRLPNTSAGSVGMDQVPMEAAEGE